MHIDLRTPKVRYYTSLSAIYVLTLGFGWAVLHPGVLPGSSHAAALTAPAGQPLPTKPHVKTVAGRPVRIVIPASGVDLPVDKGYYDSASQSWTLSGYNAQFAMFSRPANNITGDTFIYGHNNNYVFGALRHNTPAEGASALLYTDNGHIFGYSFQSVRSVAPEDTSILNYEGPPILTILTCTGSFNEWRTLYRFNFTGVVQ